MVFFCLELLVKVDRHEILHPLMYNMTLFSQIYFLPYYRAGRSKKGPGETLYGYPPYFFWFASSFYLVWQLFGCSQKKSFLTYFPISRFADP